MKQYLKFYPSFLDFLTLREAYILSNFINLQTTSFGGKAFYQTYNQVNKIIPISPRVYYKFLNKIEKLGILQRSKTQGNKNSLYIKLDILSEITNTPALEIRGSKKRSIKNDIPILTNKESSADHLETIPKRSIISSVEFDSIFTLN